MICLSRACRLIEHRRANPRQGRISRILRISPDRPVSVVNVSHCTFPFLFCSPREKGTHLHGKRRRGSRARDLAKVGRRLLRHFGASTRPARAPVEKKNRGIRAKPVRLRRRPFSFSPTRYGFRCFGIVPRCFFFSLVPWKFRVHAACGWSVPWIWNVCKGCCYICYLLSCGMNHKILSGRV